MISKSQCIVLHAIKYTDHSVILHFFSLDWGRKAAILRGVGGKKTKKSALIQPFTLVEMIVDLKNEQNLSTVRSIERSHTLSSIPFDVVKSSLALFGADFLHKALPEHYQNEELFNYMHNAILWLDQTQKPANFHIHFLLQVAAHLGYQPDGEWHVDSKYFDLREGMFTNMQPEHPDFAKGEEIETLKLLLGMNFDALIHYPFRRGERRKMLQLLIDYHKMHTHGLSQLQSHEVLQTIFD